jgi:tetratricopeptide (TPR) repeat protein
MRLIYLTLCVTMLAICGCDKDAQTLDTNEENNPFVKQGQAYMDTGDWEQAEQSFLQAIASNPSIAKPHLDLAAIYHQHKSDFINAIYHYKRYTDLRPNSEKDAFINEQIQKVQMDWAQAIFEKNGVMKAIQELKVAQQKLQQMEKLEQYVQQVQQENAALNARITELQRQPTQQTIAETQEVAPVAETISDEPEPVATDHIVYTVTEGDTLSAIAKKHYGTSGKWDLIYDANRDRMKGPSDLRIGQTLIIPNDQ